jgi:hypothetical protein
MHDISITLTLRSGLFIIDEFKGFSLKFMTSQSDSILGVLNKYIFYFNTRLNNLTGVITVNGLIID